MHQDPYQRLRQQAEAALQGGGKEKLEKQRSQGKLTARDRVETLFDPGPFVELDRFVTHRCADFEMTDKKFLGDGVVTGFGTIHGKKVYIF